MKYYIQRQLNEYGPYTLADLQRYVAQGSISLSDMTRSEGMTEWTPVSQVIGNIPIPADSQRPRRGTPEAYGGGTVYAGSPHVSECRRVPCGNPTRSARFSLGAGPTDRYFHCGLFQLVLAFRRSGFVRKVKPESKGLAFLIVCHCTSIISGFIVGFMARMNHGRIRIRSWLLLVDHRCRLYLVGVFQMRSD